MRNAIRLTMVTAACLALSSPSRAQQIADPPETAPALQKYLELQPNGPHAQEAQAMLQALGEKVQTNIHNPAATTPSRKRSK